VGGLREPGGTLDAQLDNRRLATMAVSEEDTLISHANPIA
jgi:hypothetical protein